MIGDHLGAGDPRRRQRETVTGCGPYDFRSAVLGLASWSCFLRLMRLPVRARLAGAAGTGPEWPHARPRTGRAAPPPPDWAAA
ncbi:hypothetical protein [Microtetraspora malaysiensis]|uniref:Uncharacterized protein n=1 Tax=Microtetraspora malaysiensis TaxID=161358 RepID=A0ABW6SQG9_9ACTN